MRSVCVVRHPKPPVLVREFCDDGLGGCDWGVSCDVVKKIEAA